MQINAIAACSGSLSGETLPDIHQSKRLATLYGVTLNKLAEFDLDVSQITEAIAYINRETAEKIDWTGTWAKRYPILARYQGAVDIASYARRLREMIDELKVQYDYSKQDAMLALKDILYYVWKGSKRTTV